MTGEFALAGVYLPSLLVCIFAAFLCSTAIRRLFTWLRVYWCVWHRPLFDFAVFVLILGALVNLLRTTS